MITDAILQFRNLRFLATSLKRDNFFRRLVHVMPAGVLYMGLNACNPMDKLVNNSNLLAIAPVLHQCEKMLVTDFASVEKNSFVNGEISKCILKKIQPKNETALYTHLDIQKPNMADAWVMGTTTFGDSVIIRYVKKPDSKVVLQWLRCTMDATGSISTIEARVFQKNLLFEASRYYRLEFGLQRGAYYLKKSMISGRQGFGFAAHDTFCLRTTYFYK